MKDVRMIDDPQSEIFLVREDTIEGPGKIGLQNTVHDAIDAIIAGMSEAQGTSLYADRRHGQTGKINEYGPDIFSSEDENAYAVYRVSPPGSYRGGGLDEFRDNLNAQYLFHVMVCDASAELAEDFTALSSAVRSEADLATIDEAIGYARESAKACERYGDYDLQHFDHRIRILLSNSGLRRNLDGHLEPRVDIRKISAGLPVSKPSTDKLTFEYSTDDGATWWKAYELIYLSAEGTLSFGVERQWVTEDTPLTVRQVHAIDDALWPALEVIAKGRSWSISAELADHRAAGADIPEGIQSIRFRHPSSMTFGGRAKVAMRANARRMLKLFEDIEAIRVKLQDRLPDIVDDGQESFAAMNKPAREGSQGAELQQAIDIFHTLLVDQVETLATLSNEAIEMLEAFVGDN